MVILELLALPTPEVGRAQQLSHKSIAVMVLVI